MAPVYIVYHLQMRFAIFKKARADLSPWTHMAGGMINDVLEETPLNKKTETSSVKEVIKIRWKSCNELNEEDARFCKNCGEKL